MSSGLRVLRFGALHNEAEPGTRHDSEPGRDIQQHRLHPRLGLGEPRVATKGKPLVVLHLITSRRSRRDVRCCFVAATVSAFSACLPFWLGLVSERLAELIRRLINQTVLDCQTCLLSCPTFIHCALLFRLAVFPSRTGLAAYLCFSTTFSRRPRLVRNKCSTAQRACCPKL